MRFAVVLALLVAACAGPLAGPTPTPATSPLPVVELKYRLFEQLGRPWYCDSDFYPIARADELELARERLVEMQADAVAFPAILRHNSLAAGGALTDPQLLAVYRDWKALRALQLEAGGSTYRFSYRVQKGTGEKQGELLEGSIDAYGRVNVSTRAAIGPLNCPICLSAATLIDTPAGRVRVTDLRRGMLVWTTDGSGSRVSAPILDLGSAEAPAGHEILRLTLADGRTVAASAGHPTADGRTVGALRTGDGLDGSTVSSIERLPYRGRTYDLLPSGATGAYWADGVLLGSTLQP